MIDSQTTDRVRALLDRSVSIDEVRCARDEPLDDSERETILALVRWFRRRYPSGAERLAYVRQAYARWNRVDAIPITSRDREP